MAYSQIFNMENMSFNAIRENEILTKICEFTVFIKFIGVVKYILNVKFFIFFLFIHFNIYFVWKI